MKISQIKKLIQNNKIFILIFIVLVSCDNTGGTSDGNMSSMVSDPPAMDPAPAPPANPTPMPTTQPAPPPVNPTPMPTMQPVPPPPPNPTPMPTMQPAPQPPPPPPPGGPLDDFQSEVLDLVNEARAQSRNCGADFFSAAPPVVWDNRIEDSAQLHSEDMALNQNFSHTGTDGSNAGDRLLMQGYNWRTWGENILVGLDDAADAINAWLGSPGHCSIIMNPTLQEVGAGVAQGIFQGRTASYWTLVFATEN